jgi:hypothetical protein
VIGRMPVAGARRRRVAAVVVVLAGIALALPGFLADAAPTPDGLFYEAHVGILEGTPPDSAYRAAFTGDRAGAVAAVSDGPTGWVRILDPGWVAYSSQFYERRWFVPALAATIHLAGGGDVPAALRVSSMLGYALIGIALFGLLVQRYRPDLSAVVAIGCLCFPVLWRWSFAEGVDSWALVLQILGVLALVLIADRGVRWLPLWIGSVALLSLTRDATVVLGVCALAVLAAQWGDLTTRRRNLAVALTGLAAALPAPLLLGASLRDSLAYSMTVYRVPPDASWGFVAAHYGSQLVHTLISDAVTPRSEGLLGVLSYLMIGLAVVCVGALFVPWRSPDVVTVLGRASVVGGVVLFLLALSPQALRIELTFVPAVALGAARCLRLVSTFWGYSPGKCSRARSAPTWSSPAAASARRRSGRPRGPGAAGRAARPG